jgi:hypothetical protein
MERQVFLFDVDGKKALGFDTGLDSRAFARAKFAQFITEPGLIVSLDGSNSSVNLWKAEGVVEYSEAEAATMVVWGPPFKGQRLDLLLHDNDKRDDALAAIRIWIQAVLALGKEREIPLWPCAALIGESQSNEVFFAPMDISKNCLMAKESNKINNRYVHPDLNGMNAAAFTAAAMLYQVFAGPPAFPAITDEIVLHEDMREGNFLPIRLAAPGLDDKLAALIQTALSQKAFSQNVKKGGVFPNGLRLLEGFLAALRADSPPSFFNLLSEADTLSIEKEKTQYLKTKTAEVKTRRFVKRNAAILLGCLAALVIAVLIAKSIVNSRSALTTAGMGPVQVVETYYNSFGKLDHMLMDACVIKSAGKDDINMVMNFYIISKLRQAYEQNLSPSIISARDWLEAGGGRVNVQVFGITDLQITDSREQSVVTELVEVSNEALYRVDYTLWVPGEVEDDSETGQDAMTDKRAVEYLPPKSFRRADLVTLVQKKGNWRISEIKRLSAE